ncbi:MAG TPA: hypothetical protein VN577_20485 [Terriglobales bacterium]|nr:hypothetical protein [Terriglobales bacterium]
MVNPKPQLCLHGRERQILFIPLALLAFIALAISPAVAGETSTSGTFQTTNQSIWSSGTAFSYDYYKDLGTTFSANPSIGDIGCFLGACAGAEASLYLSGNIGLRIGAHVDGGSVDAAIPFNATVSAPNFVYVGQSLTPTAAIGLGTTSFSATGPTAGAYTDFYANFYASGSAEVCYVVDCSGTSGVLFNGGFTQELLAVNRNNDGELRILGLDVGMSGSVGPVSFSFNPSINGASATGGETISAVASTDVANVGVDLAQVVASAVGIPISGSLGGVINWSLLSASATLDTLFNQHFSMDSSVAVRLHVEETGEDVWCYMGMGCGAIGAAEHTGMYTITPYYYGSALFGNQTGISLAPGYDVSILYAEIPGFLSLGPLAQWSNNFPLPEISVFDNSFNLDGFDVIAGTPFQVQIVPEPCSILLLGTGFLATARLLRRRTKKG